MQKAASELSSSSFSKRGLLHNLSYKKTFYSCETKLFQVKSCVQSLFEIRLKITTNYSFWSSTVGRGDCTVQTSRSRHLNSRVPYTSRPPFSGLSSPRPASLYCWYRLCCPCLRLIHLPYSITLSMISILSRSLWVHLKNHFVKYHS